MTGYFKAGNHLCKQFVPEDLPDGAPVSEMGDHFRKSRSHTQSAIHPSIQPAIRPSIHLSRQAPSQAGTASWPARQTVQAGTQPGTSPLCLMTGTPICPLTIPSVH